MACKDEDGKDVSYDFIRNQDGIYTVQVSPQAIAAGARVEYLWHYFEPALQHLRKSRTEMIPDSASAKELVGLLINALKQSATYTEFKSKCAELVTPQIGKLSRQQITEILQVYIRTLPESDVDSDGRNFSTLKKVLLNGSCGVWRASRSCFCYVT